MANRIAVLALGAGLAMATSMQAADAQSGLCLQLSNQLAAIDSGGGFRMQSPRYQQYDRAVSDQAAQIAKTQRASRLNGCEGLFKLNQANCDRIRTSLNQMNANLVKLRRTRDQLGSESGPADNGRRNAILAEMTQYGCEQRSRGNQFLVSQEPRRRSLLEQIFGVRTYREDGTRGNNEFDPDAAFFGRYGTYRTLCVRKCDGYYFPISFSTVRERFERDATICQSMCPDNDVELYIHGMPNQESEDMVSWLTNEPYTNLSTAFSYRQKLNPECTCKFRAQFITEIAGSEQVTEIGGARDPGQGPSRLPLRRADPGIDPETAANLAGGLTAQTIATLGVASEEAPPPVADLSRKIRVVGPEFFPVQ